MLRAIIIGTGRGALSTAEGLLSRGIWPAILEPTGWLAGRICTPFELARTQSRKTALIVGELHLNCLIKRFYWVGDEICSVHVINKITGELRLFTCDFLYSSLSTDSLISTVTYKRQAKLPEMEKFMNFSVLGKALQQQSIGA